MLAPALMLHRACKLSWVVESLQRGEPEQPGSSQLHYLCCGPAIPVILESV